jgi:hypothetical protein
MSPASCDGHTCLEADPNGKGCHPAEEMSPPGGSVTARPNDGLVTFVPVLAPAPGGSYRGGVRWVRSSWVDIVWAVFVVVNLLGMREMGAWSTIPFLVIWVSLTLVYGWRMWRLQPAILTVAVVTLAHADHGGARPRGAHRAVGHRPDGRRGRARGHRRACATAQAVEPHAATRLGRQPPGSSTWRQSGSTRS